MRRISDHEIAETLREAAFIVEKRGLAKGILRDLDGRVCLEGAINLAIFNEVNPHFDAFSSQGMSLREAVFAQLRQLTGKSFYELIAWSNSEDTTAEQVQNLFRKATEGLTDADADSI